MQLFLADVNSDIENQIKAYKLFVEAWENGEMAKSDKNENLKCYFEFTPWRGGGMFM